MLLALAVLVAMSAATGSRYVEEYGDGRMTLFMVLGLPLALTYVVIRTRRFPFARLVADWLPVPGLVVAYESLKLLHANRMREWLGIAPKDALMIRIDELLFGRALPLRLEWTAAPWFINLMWIAYAWVFYLLPLVLLGAAYARDRQLFLRLRRAMVIGMLGGYVLYLLIPVAGPFFTIGEQFHVTILTQPYLERLTISTFRYDYDCFPSLHTAIPWFLVLVAWPSLGKVGRTLGVVACVAVTVSTVTLRFHYGIDVIAGLIWAVIVWRVALLTAPATTPSPAYSSASSAFQ